MTKESIPGWIDKRTLTAVIAGALLTGGGFLGFGSRAESKPDCMTSAQADKLTESIAGLREAVAELKGVLVGQGKR